MRRILLTILLSVSVASLVKAQETTGAVAETVRKEAMQLEHEKVQCFLSTARANNSCADWIQKNYADGDLDITDLGGSPRRRSKAEIMDEFKSGQRKFLAFDQTVHVINVYGQGGNGTTAVVTYITKGTSENNGKSSPFDDFGVDIWVKQSGQWRLVLMNTRVAY